MLTAMTTCMCCFAPCCMHSQVVETEKERRESEIEHRRIMEECTRVMEEYKNTEKRLRSHIVKSRLFYSTVYMLACFN